MASYIQRDIKTFDDGELDISSGDIEIATTQQSQRQLLINTVSTTRGGYPLDRLVGWGADRYIGRFNTPITHQVMKEDLLSGLSAVDDLAMEDIDFAISFLTEEKVAIIIRHSGMFYDEDGYLINEPVVLGWTLSFKTGSIELEESND